MNQKAKNFFLTSKKFIIIFDVLWSPVTLLSTIWLKAVKKGLRVLPVSEKIFMKVGVLPVPDQYYQPLINPKKYLKDSLKKNRKLPGVNFHNGEEQVTLLSKFYYNEELLSFPLEKTDKLEYYYHNINFGSGDAEYLYNIVRHFKSKKIIEIGCGHSTLMIRNAVKMNTKEDAGYQCDHICIEPYEMSWLTQLNINVIRQKVEDVDLSVFTSLQKNDILFIDSSHIIRPQGDVLFEYLQLLPILKSGVLIHIHDIFTPNEYPDDWLNNKHLMWNEQYLLEAFLCFNDQFTILGALNYLYHNYTDKLLDKCPVLAKEGNREPGSFWMVRK